MNSIDMTDSAIEIRVLHTLDRIPSRRASATCDLADARRSGGRAVATAGHRAKEWWTGAGRLRWTTSRSACCLASSVVPRAASLKHCSHMMGVLQSHRGRGIGQLLKQRQQELVQAQGIDLITWTYDPLETANALLNISPARRDLPHLFPECVRRDER